MSTDFEVQSYLTLYKELIKNIELYFNEKIDFMNIRTSEFFEKYKIRYKIGKKISTQEQPISDILMTVYVLRKYDIKYLDSRTKEFKIQEGNKRYVPVFEMRFNFFDNPNEFKNSIIENNSIYFDINSDKYFAPNESVFYFVEPCCISMPCTEEEYFMYSLKVSNALDIKTYEEIDSLRKEIKDKSNYINSITERSECKFCNELQSIKICLYNIERNDFNEINEINEIFKSTIQEENND